VTRKYGRDYGGADHHLRDHGAKAAIRDVGGRSTSRTGECDKIAKLIPAAARHRPSTEALEESSAASRRCYEKDDRIRQLLDRVEAASRG
jgi:DNA polymerase III alpha subunit